MERDYQPIVVEVEQQITAQDALARRMQVVVDRLWHHLHEKRVSWVGFYLKVSDRDEMVLGPHRDKPACSPIGMQGACGQAFLDKKALVFRNVKELGESYIACDPRDQSEVVIPIYYDRSAQPCGVLDLDSFDIGAFDESDVEGLNRVLAVAGLLPPCDQTVTPPVSVTASASSHAEPQFAEAIDSLWRTTVGDPRVCVAVLDGPVDRSHPAFADADLTLLPTLVPAVPDGGSASQHGTHVASVIFAKHDGRLRGLAPRCRGLIVPIYRDGPDGSLAPCSHIDLARALLQAAQNGANVVNISGGQLEQTGTAHPLLANAVQTCAARGVLIVAAAGNQGCDCLNVPAALPSVLAVGAMDSRGEPLEFSNWGQSYGTQGILAPGENIPGAMPGGGIVTQSGTSYATAVVSGVVGLLLSLQLQRGQSPDPQFIREKIVDSALGCEYQRIANCRRVLAGRLNVAGAVSSVLAGVRTMPDESELHDNHQSATPAGADTNPAAAQLPAPQVQPAGSDGNGPKASGTPPPLPTVSTGDSRKQQEAKASRSVDPGRVSPSTCGCGCGGGTPAQLVYALGQLGFDYGTEARRDSIMQHMKQPANPHDPNQLLTYLDKNPWDATEIIWTLNLDATPIYAVQPQGPFASEACKRLCDFLREQLAKGVERSSHPGWIVGSTRLFTGQVVPVIHPVIRGMYSWTTCALVEAACGKSPADNASQAAKDAYAQKAQAVENFLRRVYDELRNLGVTPQERAINYSATNALLVAEVFKDAIKEEMDLDTIEVERSPICRPYSDCWDVKLTFFDPKKVFERAKKVYRFCCDVSDPDPCMVGPIRSWFVR